MSAYSWGQAKEQKDQICGKPWGEEGKLLVLVLRHVKEGNLTSYSGWLL